MSLQIETEAAGIPTARSAHDLPVGTWFTDDTGQVYVIAMDDVAGVKRVVCLGRMARPFIAAADPAEFTKLDVLPLGTVLKIVESA